MTTSAACLTWWSCPCTAWEGGTAGCACFLPSNVWPLLTGICSHGGNSASGQPRILGAFAIRGPFRAGGTRRNLKIK